MLKLDTYNSPNSEIVQFIVKGNAINAPAYSIGTGQVTPEGSEYIQNHEAVLSCLSSFRRTLYPCCHRILFRKWWTWWFR